MSKYKPIITLEDVELDLRKLAKTVKRDSNDEWHFISELTKKIELLEKRVCYLENNNNGVD